MKKSMKFLSIIFVMLLIVSACGKTKEKEETNNVVSHTPPVSKHETNPIVTMEMENGGIVQMELYPKVAPQSVDNFVTLINDGFYDGLTFHRVIPGFMVQGGDPNGNGTGGPGYGILGEFNNNGVTNDLKHEVGVLSMARSAMPDSAGSQFFIMVEDSPHLDGDYAAFGRVISGMEVVNEIVSTPTDGEKPKEDQKIKKMTVDTKGETYDAPEKL